MSLGIVSVALHEDPWYTFNYVVMCRNCQKVTVKLNQTNDQRNRRNRRRRNRITGNYCKVLGNYRVKLKQNKEVWPVTYRN